LPFAFRKFAGGETAEAGIQPRFLALRAEVRRWGWLAAASFTGRLAAFLAAFRRRTLRRSFKSAARSDFLVLLGMAHSLRRLCRGFPQNKTLGIKARK
jgi:hypothetical protein